MRINKHIYKGCLFIKRRTKLNWKLVISKLRSNKKVVQNCKIINQMGTEIETREI